MPGGVIYTDEALGEHRYLVLRRIILRILYVPQWSVSLLVLRPQMAHPVTVYLNSDYPTILVESCAASL